MANKTECFQLGVDLASGLLWKDMGYGELGRSEPLRL